ncbi:Ubiquitin carboxyl-terminal hydrolase CYLD [Liparis tanakae]|uniref:Ubiquitin carboxyl-terminal hydrolase CYLD n=1 Tax=Liparis tanakae TaxID=230148 RepID=A0A4Z2FWQ1_9TELE|nr:Ubiquitin carboxyl-terminal hydrolase CYLD [Liparis tanakae]
MVVFHQLMVVFHQLMVVFHQLMVVFHQLMVVFHQLMVVFPSGSRGPSLHPVPAVGEDPAKSLTDTPPDFNAASPPSRAPPPASLSSDNKFHSLPFSLNRKAGPIDSMSHGPLSLSVQSVMGEQPETPSPVAPPSPHPATPLSRGQPGLEVGSLVEVKENPPLCGVIRWVGLPPGLLEPLAGLELVSTAAVTRR